MARTKKRNDSDNELEEGSAWTFFTNHTHVLVFLSLHGDAPLRDVAAAIGITERAVQKIVHELESAGVIIKTKVGRQNSYKLNRDVNLRHPLERHCTIGVILDAVTKGSAKRLPTK